MMKKWLAVGLLTISMGGLVACGSADEADACSSDNDCKGDRICDAGECVSPVSGTNPNSSTNPDSSTNPNNSSTNPTGSTSPNNTSNPDNPSNPNNTGSTTNPDNGTPDGALGAECLSAVQCDSAYCREEAGAIGGVCAVNDFGDMCQGNSDCEYGACLFENVDVDVFGYCTAQCESFADCPTFWDCSEVGNASGTYCIQN